MSKFISEAGKNTPEIRFDPSSNIFYIRGKSFPENAKKHYLPFTEWLKANRIPPGSTIELNFEYISSSSVIAVLELLREIEKLEKNISVKWVYEDGDDDMKAVGANYQKLCGLQFEYIIS
ncbi:MAG: DUF1987 domain-containing protein [Bacteroidota bacterium]